MSPMDAPAPLSDQSFPHAILHVDGDAFFTSVEQALHPKLRARPVVTGKERGIIACASYEAKARGIKRGIPLWDARRMCPELVVLPSDYETYSIMSERMFEIMRRFTPTVETYSIDEGFADITGMRSYFCCDYDQIARNLQQTIHRELDLTVSIGLSVSKSLAKIASDYDKPHGCTCVPARRIHTFLSRISTAEVWGLGRSRQALLARSGIRTAWDFITCPEAWVRKNLHKPGVEIWQELRGQPVLPWNNQPEPPKASIQKTRTFSAPSDDSNLIYAKLIRNLESACIKLRRHNLRAGEITAFLRTRDYQTAARTMRLSNSIHAAQAAAPVIHILFQHLYQPGTSYRATGIILSHLSGDQAYQYTLFENTPRTQQIQALARTMDAIQVQYGKHSVFLAPGLHRNQAPVHARDTPVWRKTHLLPGETARKRIRIPLLDLQV